MGLPSRLRAVIFDLDGTLVDSKKDLTDLHKTVKGFVDNEQHKKYLGREHISLVDSYMETLEGRRRCSAIGPGETLRRDRGRRSESIRRLGGQAPDANVSSTPAERSARTSNQPPKPATATPETSIMATIAAWKSMAN